MYFQFAFVFASPRIKRHDAGLDLRARHRAFGLLDASIALIIAALAITAGARYYTQYLDNQIARTSADQMRGVSSAVSKYVQDNYGAILSDVDAGGGTYNLNIAALQPVYLSPDFQDKNSYGQSYVISVRRPTPGVNKLDTLVYTQGGEAFTNSLGLAMSQIVGQGGGFVTDTGALKTTYDGWTTNLASFNANPGPGHLVNALFFDTTGSLNASYLYRNKVPGRPELNRMETDIDLNTNGLNNVGTVNAQTVNGQSVNANTVNAQNVTTNTVVVSGNANVGGALTVNGSLTAAGPMTAQSTFLANSTATIGGTLTVGGAANVTGDVTSSGNVNAGRFVPYTGFSVNTACSPNGAIGSDSSGKTLSCQGGVWKQNGSTNCPGGYPVGTIEGMGYWDAGYHYQVCRSDGSWQSFVTWPD